MTTISTKRFSYWIIAISSILATSLPAIGALPTIQLTDNDYKNEYPRVRAS